MSVAEQISPELALIDPDLAVWARSQLTLAESIRETHAASDDTPVGHAPILHERVPEPLVEPHPRSASRSNTRRVALVACLALVALIGGDGAGDAQRPSAVLSEPAALGTAPPLAPPTHIATPPRRTHARAKNTPSTRSQRTRTTAKAPVHAAAPPATITTQPTTPRASEPPGTMTVTSPPASSNFGAASTGGPPKTTTLLNWRARRSASYYNVVVWTKGRRLLDLWPTAPSVLLNRAGLAPGKYDWFVYPGVGDKAAHRFGALAAHGSFTIRR